MNRLWATSLFAAGLLMACEASPAGAGASMPDVRQPASGGDTGPRDVPDVDEAEPDEPAPDVTEDTETGTMEPDVIVDDGFLRPDTSPADVAEDAPSDTPDPDASPDVQPPDAVTIDTDRDFAIDASGRGDCLEWSITSPYDTFDFKGDIFTVLYTVRNTCAESMVFRVEHFNDFFPLAIHKNGEFWTYLGNCPGEGPEHERSFRTINEGITRGFTWQAESHQRLLTQCGVEYDEAAAYALVGYGSSPISTFEPMSERYPLTEPIPILILD